MLIKKKSFSNFSTYALKATNSKNTIFLIFESSKTYLTVTLLLFGELLVSHE